MNFNWATKNGQIDRGYLTALSSNTDTAYYGSTKFWKYFIIYPKWHCHTTVLFCQLCHYHYTERCKNKVLAGFVVVYWMDGEYSNNCDVTSSPSVEHWTGTNIRFNCKDFSKVLSLYNPFHDNSIITPNESPAVVRVNV